MGSMKILAILLVLGILLFVALMVWGAGKNGNHKQGDSRAEADNFKKDSDSGKHSNLDSFKGMLGGFGPTLKASSLNPVGTKFDLAKNSSFSITILKDDKKHKFRQAKFLMQPVNCARVTYSAFDSQDVDDHLRNQNTKDIPDLKPEFTFTILETGGTLVVIRNPDVSSNIGPCKVELE